jgi:peptidoglycan/xylan/chitin deacetylase (PgdA/CDA1 family)
VSRTVRRLSTHGWRATAQFLVPVGLAAGAHMVPSIVSLGQWLPIRALPGDLCRWRGTNPSGVALTFDDGPDPRTTPLVLDRLDQLSLAATFFCLGEQVAAHPELVGEIRDRGHQVETHGFRHEHHFVRSPRWVRADLSSAMDAMEQVGIHPRWFRPPFGQTTGATMVEARRHNLRLVLWSAWGREWDEPDASSVARRVRAGIGPGAIVLLHDADLQSPPGSSQRAAEALGPIAEDLHRQGLAPLTLDELVGLSR